MMVTDAQTWKAEPGLGADFAICRFESGFARIWPETHTMGYWGTGMCGMGVEDNVKLANSVVPPAIGSTRSVELIYVGFWRRVAAYALDLVILVPYALVARQLIYASRTAYLVNLILGTIIALIFEVYLVKRYGGSPGKLIMGIRIARLDGSKVGYRDAVIRYSVLFLINALLSVALLMSLYGMSDVEYAAFTSAQAHVKALEAGAPAWYQPVQIAGAVWAYSEFLVLLTNKKRRALHDFMAGTIVIRHAAAKARE
jgi:uncharacterized RDD family membrane protein YckC